jgi:hypothetical protein
VLHGDRRVVLGSLAAYAALVFVTDLGLMPDVLGGGPALVTLLAFPVMLGILVGRPWVAVAVFAIVLATALLPDRTVVENTANSTTYTIYSNTLVPNVLFALVAAVAAYMGTTLRIRREPVA